MLSTLQAVSKVLAFEAVLAPYGRHALGQRARQAQFRILNKFDVVDNFKTDIAEQSPDSLEN